MYRLYYYTKFKQKIPLYIITGTQYGIIRDQNRIGSLSILRKGGDAMTIFESLSLMIAFGLLIVTILSFHKRK